jgi:hypothetical protein
MGEQQMQYGYFGHITKYDKTEDGTLMVYGKAAGPDLDLDGQRCDPAWLKTAMPAWHAWGNVREQHANIAAGVGVELTQDGDDWYLKAEIVDPGTIRKVEKRVLKGFSVGIVNGRVIKSAKAPNGVIDDGTVAEVSLVDRPCNPTATMSIAKSVGGGTLAPVEVGDIDEDGAEVVAIIDIPELDVSEPHTLTSAEGVTGRILLANPGMTASDIRIEKSATWYRTALRTVEDALAGQFSSTIPFITKAAKAGDDAEHADVSAAYVAMDQILDLVIAEAQQAKGGRVKELRDIEVLLSACRALCCFIECERDEDGDELGDHDVSDYDLGDDDKAYMVKAFGAWGDDTLVKGVSADERREAKSDGDTMPDGSYPITNQSQLDSAVHLAGHSKTYSKDKVMAHIRRQARKHGLSLPGATTDKAAGAGTDAAATVDGATAEIITKAVTAAQSEFRAAHEAEVATLRADLEKALAAPTPGGPVTFKHVKTTSSAPRQVPTENSPEYWHTLAKTPGLDLGVSQAYLAKAAALTPGAST